MAATRIRARTNIGASTIDPPERATPTTRIKWTRVQAKAPWTFPIVRKKEPEASSVARCRELLGDDANTLTDDEVLAVARKAEALAHIMSTWRCRTCRFNNRNGQTTLLAEVG